MPRSLSRSTFDITGALVLGRNFTLIVEKMGRNFTLIVEKMGRNFTYYGINHYSDGTLLIIELLADVSRHRLGWNTK